MKLRMLISLLPAVMAEFDSCLRPSGEWIGFDQGTGQSRGAGATYHGGNIYVAGMALGNFSFATKHVDGTYSDHAGVQTANHDDTHDTVTDRHFTGSGAGRVGMDLTITKVSEAGIPSAVVFAADAVPHPTAGADGKTSTRVYGQFTAVAGFTGDTNIHMVAAVGQHVGDLTVPMNDGTFKKFPNSKFVSYDYNGIVAKVDMSTGKALWATNTGMTSEAGRLYADAVATTALGHVIVTGGQTPNRRDYTGRMAKYDGATGTKVWAVDFDEIFQMSNIATDGETALVTGTFKGVGVTKFGGNLTSCENGESKTAFVASFDVSGTSGPVANWMKLIGCGEGKALRIGSDSLFVAGRLNTASALDADGPISKGLCTLTGNLGGYLAKLNKVDGTCMWGKDTASHARIATDGTHVWAASSDDDPVKFAENVTLAPGADDDQIFGVRYDAADGAALWVERFGGSGSSRFSDMTMTPTGPVIVGYSESEGVTVGDVTANNLQHARAKDGMTAAEKAAAPQAGDQALLVIQLSKTDKSPSCITSCDSGKIDKDTVIAAGSCYADNICLANSEFSPSRPCFRCDAATEQKVLTGPITTNHCWFGDVCHPKGEKVAAYSRYNQASVCEACQPEVKTDGYSLIAGHFHDRDFAKAETGRCSRGCSGNYYNQISEYGVVFEMQSNGCQVMPDMTPTVTVDSSSLSTIQLVAKAIKAVNEATKANKGAEKAWLYYHGDTSKCTRAKVSYKQDGKTITHEDTCENTPSAHADETAADFETILYYGQSMARVKVQQGLVILKAELNNGELSANEIADLKQDVISHMLVARYQSTIHASYQFSQGKFPQDHRTEASENWNLIKDNWAGDQNDKDRLSNLFAQTSLADNHFCTASVLLTRNLPASSSNHYGSADDVTDRSAGSLDMTFGVIAKGKEHLEKVAAGLENPLKVHTPDDLNQGRTYLSAADLGILTASRSAEGVASECTMPPPAPPPPAPPPHVETVVLTLTASGSVSDYSDTSGLQQKIATAAGVDKSLVTIKVAAASVIITATIAVPAATTATAVQASLSSTLGTTATAMTTSLGITVESEPTMTTRNVQQEESSDSGLTDGEVIGIAIGATVGGVVLLVLVGLLLRSLLFKDAKPVFTCLEKSTAEAKAAPV